MQMLKTIRGRAPLKDAPTYVLQTDSGAEFKGVFATYVKKLGVAMRCARA